MKSPSLLGLALVVAACGDNDTSKTVAGEVVDAAVDIDAPVDAPVNLCAHATGVTASFTPVTIDTCAGVPFIGCDGTNAKAAIVTITAQTAPPFIAWSVAAPFTTLSRLNTACTGLADPCGVGGAGGFQVQGVVTVAIQDTAAACGLVTINFKKVPGGG